MKVVERLRFRAAPQPLHALGRFHFLGIVGRIPEDGRFMSLRFVLLGDEMLGDSRADSDNRRRS